MRRASLLVSLLLVFPLAAQQSPEKPLMLSVMATDLSYTESDSSGRDLDAGLAVALQYRFSERWSGEVSWGKETYRYGSFTLAKGLDGTFREVKVDTNPIELTGQFNFVNDTRWRPYVGLGVRHVDAPEEDVDDEGSVTAPIVTGGVIFRLTPSFSLRGEAKVKLGSNRDWDTTFQSGLGVGFSF